MSSETVKRTVASTIVARWMPACMAGLLSSAGVAQGAATESTAALDEIIVTAQKRSESLQDVPVSMTALTERQLETLKLDDATGLAAAIPSLQVNGVLGEGTPIFSLRGVSMFDYSLNQSSPVATYVDEAYKGTLPLLGVMLFDLERVEALRGPQGTLYGKNTTGGAINLITRKPTFDTNGYLRIGAGNYKRREVEGALGGALVEDRLAARVAFTYAKDDGWFKNRYPGSPNMNSLDQWAFRVSLLFRVSDDLQATLQYAKSRQRPINYGILAVPGPDGVGGGVFSPGYFRTGLKRDEIEDPDAATRRHDTDAVSLTTKWGLSDRLELTSITTYDHGSLDVPESSDGSPLDVIKIPVFGRTDQFTQDLRIASTGDGAFGFIVGAFYQHEKVFSRNRLRYYGGFDVNGDGGVDFQDCIDSGALLACEAANQFTQVRNSWAAYADTSYQLSPAFKLRLGLRYNHDKGVLRDFKSQLLGPDGVLLASLIPGDPVNVDATLDNRLRNTATTGRIGVDFTPNDSTLIYVSGSRGYRSGAFNAQAFFAPVEATTVRPEKLTAVELGFKTTWLDGRAQVNGALFHYRYKNQQGLSVDSQTGATPLVNLGTSRVQGAEREIAARPAPPLQLRLALSVLDAEFTRGTLNGEDPDRRHLPNAPSFSSNLNVDWDAVRTDLGTVSLHLGGTYQSSQYFESLNVARLRQKGYGLLSARAAFRSADEAWELGLWARNLTNKFYMTNAINVQAGFGFDYTHRGVPRTYGIDLAYRFE